MEFKLFDAHCHLQWPKFDDLPAVLEQMEALSMGAIVIGTDIQTSAAAVKLAHAHDFLWASVGLHPNDNLDEEFDAAAYEALARDPKVVAIGECGLDYFRTEESEDNTRKQKERFLAHIGLAKKLRKPLIVHCRNAHEDMIAILGEQKLAVPVIIHFCTVSGDTAQRYLDLGCYLSFPGPVTYTDQYDDSIRLCPMEKLLIETDSPFAAPTPHRGQRNEPAYVMEVAKKVAAIKGLDAQDVAQQSARTASSVFSLAML